jgi:hypothetical protein
LFRGNHETEELKPVSVAPKLLAVWCKAFLDLSTRC